MSTNEETVLLTHRIMELEKQLDNLRLSRRVLMDLLEQIEKENKILTQKLDQKSRHLQKYKKINQHKSVYSQDFELYEFKDYLKE
ncbi:MAG: hypothetical protein FNP40_04780 [Dehalobacter sp. 4CP]|uniref:Translation initiation factor 2 n=2 Tax=Dehalobacter restrictus TaxID=55583 RepID=A0A857DG64_9FIRM|nr:MULTISPECIES: hypothetical protein [Dehalobacter]NBJ14882.1 hypothetical protein [Dehalobacter sp. 4CP]AFV01352.1 hypothetical protein DHBDCA_p324 [Dehalobacter sp. DCA]AFV04392.1 hypothetical protein DCF50_p386 [Dehalobacter sp. CF]AHF09685.1 hypothetical protein DEHRE_06020 [Dehalobacter restrictus DSM 9455]EQB21476.1 hypothetical protein UNSWDHB_1198 [Dehalobacter sp. UNSWDHB]